MRPFRLALIPAAALVAFAGQASAVTFQSDSVSGNFDSTVSVGTGIRTRSPSCSLVIANPTGPDAPAGCIAPTSGLGDQGDLNYEKWHPFTTYVKGSHELLLKMPDDFSFLGRVNWLRDFSATDTSGITSASATTGDPAVTDGLSPSARKDLRFKARLLDFWVSKTFTVGDEQARLRVGNQVISWGESLFIPGGINSTNAVDVMRLSQPGTQLKEAILPAPMVSLASGLGGGMNVEGYVQTNWNASYMPPTGSYWSNVNGLGNGDSAYGLTTVKPRNTPQWGLALRYQPEGTQLNLGLYGMSYNDKSPQFSANIRGTGAVGWTYAQDRKLVGVSANFPVGDWAVGSELSWRPKDAVSLNTNSGCTSQNGNCWVDLDKFQWNLTGLFSATPSNAQGMLEALHADTATLLAELVVIDYPGLHQTYGADTVAAGGWGWGQLTNSSAAQRPVGTKVSDGFNFDFSWVYDGTLIKGWQVVPEVFFFQAVSGRTPNVAGTFMSGARSANFTVSFIQNPAKWQAAVNYAIFRGGSSSFDQPYRDRDFIGINLSRNF
jgi:hypothetical protein